jgi:hypothetical protein
MNRVFVAILLALASACLWAAPAVQARPQTPAEGRFAPWTGEVPACDEPSVLWNIQTRFYDAETEYWKSGLEMVGFDRFHETAYRSNGTYFIPRRYCTARVFLNDGKTRQLTYWIGEDLGFAGGDYLGLLPLTGRTNVFSNWGVTFCVNGLDRHYAYGQGCMAARP